MARRGTDVWLHRPGRALGDLASLSAETSPNHLNLSGPTGALSISTRLWPPMARESLPEDLKSWERSTEPPGHHGKHHDHPHPDSDRGHDAGPG